MDIWVSIITGVISGVISSIIATCIIGVYYKSKKPRIIISNKIAKNDLDEYRIKIVNKSPFYLSNVIVHARLITILNGMGGNVISVQNLDVPPAHIQLIDPYSTDKSNSSYAIWIGISKMLDTIWTDDSITSLKVTVYCSGVKYATRIILPSESS